MPFKGIPVKLGGLEAQYRNVWATMHLLLVTDNAGERGHMILFAPLLNVAPIW